MFALVVIRFRSGHSIAPSGQPLMSNKYLDVLTQIVRQPRHFVQDAKNLTIGIMRSASLKSGESAPEIIDFSRGGFRFRSEEPVQESETIVLRLADEANGLSLELPGTVRWTRDLTDNRHEAGVQFESEIDYEELGDLFIAGFLSTDEVPLTP